MINIPQQDSKFPIGKLFNTIGDSVRENRVIDSEHIRTSQTKDGLKLYIADSFTNQNKGTTYQRAFSLNDNYFPGDIVRVTAAPYYDIETETILDGLINGVYVCVHFVHGKRDSDIIKRFNDEKLYNYYKQYVQLDDVDYFPMWPEPTRDVVDDGTVEGAKGKYWELIGMLPDKLAVCVDGVPKEYWVGIAPVSGSL